MMNHIMIDSITCWIIIVSGLLIILFIMTLGKDELGSEDDIWTATELCHRLSMIMKIPAQELMIMWGNPSKHQLLTQKTDQFIESIYRKWVINEHFDSNLRVSITVDVLWKNGAKTTFSGTPTWDELPHKVRSHFIKNSEPISLIMDLPFHQSNLGE